MLVVDEAGMLGTRLLASLAGEAGRAKAKLVLVGDPRQLPAVEAGGLLAALARRHGFVELVENRRQRDPEEQLISTALRHGRTRLAVRRLDEHGRLTVTRNSDALRDQMVLDWWHHREAGRDAVMGAAERRPGPQRQGPRRPGGRGAARAAGAVVDGQRFCVGDEVLALQNRYDLGVLNGDLGTVVGAGKGSLHLRCSADRHVSLPLDYVAHHLQHGYARTVHKAQGLTCDAALLLGDDTLYAELGYTGLTRGRQENHLYTVVGEGLGAEDDGLAHLVKALGTSQAKSAAIDFVDPPVLA